MPSELTLRPAEAADTDALATLFLRAREAAYPAIPLPVHPPDDVRRWMATHVDEPHHELWLAEDDPRPGPPKGPVGLLLVEGDWLHSLYVAPGRTGEGVGAVLLDLAKSLRPGGLGLYVFETNLGARRFYTAHGFVEVRRPDGTDRTDNEEGCPDVEMAWPQSAPAHEPPPGGAA